MHTIGIIAALRQEADPFIKGLDASHCSHAGPLTVHRGAVGERPVSLVVSGVGRSAARDAAEALIELSRPNLIISIGFAGGLAEEAAAGTVVVGSEIVDDAGGREAFPAPDGFVLPAGAKRGVILTSRRFIHAVDHRRDLWDRFGAVAVDMESIHIGRIARAAAIPVLVVRVISDDLSAELPLMGSVMTTDGRLDIQRAIRYFLFHPDTIIPFVRFIGGLKSHADTLNRYLRQLIISLPKA